MNQVSVRDLLEKSRQSVIGITEIVIDVRFLIIKVNLG